MGVSLTNFHALDRRWIYLILIVVLVVSLIYGPSETPVVLPSSQSLYDAVDAAPAGPEDGKIILIGSTFSASTLGENGNQLRAVVRHLMLRHKRFAVMGVSEPQGAKIGPTIVAALAKQYGYEYGVDWIDFGYQVGTLSFYKSFPKDIIGTVKKDGQQKKPLSTFRIMQGITSINASVPLHIEFTASNSVFNWVQVVQPSTQPRLKLGYGCTGVMASEAYPYLDSGQLVGMLPGLKGAADYERLVDDLEAGELAAGRVKKLYDPTASVLNMSKSARQLMFTQGAAHVVILLFILLGNISMLLSRRKARKPEKETTNG